MNEGTIYNVQMYKGAMCSNVQVTNSKGFETRNETYNRLKNSIL